MDPQSDLHGPTNGYTFCPMNSAATLPLPSLLPTGDTANINLSSGDSYIGEVMAVRGDLVTLRNYSAWYDGDPAPYNSPYFDDEVTVRVTHEDTVTTSGGDEDDCCPVCPTVPAYLAARNTCPATLPRRY